MVVQLKLTQVTSAVTTLELPLCEKVNCQVLPSVDCLPPVCDTVPTPDSVQVPSIAMPLLSQVTFSVRRRVAAG